jgi:F0F1-type ATP synthase beta subunit
MKRDLSCPKRQKKVVDLLVPYAKGDKIGLSEGAGVGKIRTLGR